MNITARLGLLLLGLGLSAPAGALETDFGARLKLTGFSEGDRDLGTAASGDTQETFVDFNPEGHVQFTPEFAAHTRLQGFFSTGDVVLNEDERPVTSNRYGALRELWVEYGGLTSYPGEVLRLGLQRVREPDGLWWDRDIESLRWIFDTTLFQGQFGVAEQFDNYRTDEIEISPSQRDRRYYFAGLNHQWIPNHRFGLRLTHAADHSERLALGETADSSSKLQDRRFTWVGLHADNGFYDYRRRAPLTYWFILGALRGQQESTQVDPLTGIAAAETSRDVAAFAGDAGLRLQARGALPLQGGLGYVYAEGGRQGKHSNLFVQTGLHSNRSRFTGTRSLMHRFNEAYQADFSNLRSATAFLSLPLERSDASLVYQYFQRDDLGSPISTDGLDVAPSTDSRNLGQGWDLVLTRYFERLGSTRVKGATDVEDLRTNVRLRGAVFQPGDAYGGTVRDQYRVLLELALWF